MNAISFKDVTKKFRSWKDRPSIKALLSQIPTMKINWGKKTEHIVLKNISFDIRKGEFVGIMGKNGAGKSTLLKLISQIYHPTSGTIEHYGRVAPLLELGAGFAIELDGYENIFLNASILGYSKSAVETKLKDIIDFSELGEDLFKPVRNYSSGMLVRLGFAIAVHLDADILLFDEVLAVGDVGFQEKCLRKIDELYKAGKTIILVTHDPRQVEKHCSRSLIFANQSLIFDGDPGMGAKVYTGLF